MSDWIYVTETNKLAVGEHLVVDIDGVEVAIFNLDGEFYAIEDLCTHDGAEVASGLVEGDQIICPRHGARFCIKTGAVKSPPAYEDLYKFPLRIENDVIQVRDDRWE